MRRLSLLLTVPLVLPLFGSDSPREYGAKTVQVDELRGTWQVVTNEFAGQLLQFNGIGLNTYRDDKWVYTLDGRGLYEGTFTTDNSHKPGFLDETWTAGAGTGQTRKSIYQRDGDTLRTAFKRAEPLSRPKSFDDDGLFIIVWKRVK